MTEPTLFRKVLCKDREPAKGGKYIIDSGPVAFAKKRRWYIIAFGAFHQTYIKYWLEEIAEPTEDEIRDIAKSEVPSPEFGEASRMFFKAGFKKALELLKGKS